jgi:acyl carrier protein
MGLDVVELVMEVEDTFGIKIADEEYERIRTVGDFHALIVEKTGGRNESKSDAGRRDPATCLSLVAFLQVRRAITSLLDVPRNLVRPTTSLNEIMPAQQWLGRWVELEHTLGLKLPRQYSSWMQNVPVFCWPIALAAPIAYAVTGGSAGGVIAVLLGVAGISFILAWWQAQRSANELALCTVGKLTRQFLSINYSEFSARYPDTRRDGVMTKLVAIISEQLCIPVNDITPEKRFVEDLYCD